MLHVRQRLFIAIPLALGLGIAPGQSVVKANDAPPVATAPSLAAPDLDHPVPHSARRTASVAPPTQPVIGRNTATEHHTSDGLGYARVDLYNAPVGTVDVQGWHVRDLHTGPSSVSGFITPLRVPFSLRIANHGHAASLATLTNETGVTLGVGMTTSISTTATATHTVGIQTVAPSDVSIHPTLSGADIRVVTHSSADSAAVTLSLSPDPRASVWQDTDGTIRITRVITTYGDDGITPVPIIQTEYAVQQPIAIDNSHADRIAQRVGPASAHLVTTVTGAPTMRVAVDPAWLAAPDRTFPVTLDIPLATGYGSIDTTPFATVDSCAPSQSTPLPEVEVGTEGDCTQRGVLGINLSSLLPGTPVAQATLQLYTPDTVGSTPVSIYPSDAQARMPSHDSVRWDTTPHIASGAVGVAESATEGHWHSWDVTAIVQRWINDPRDAGEFLLKSDAAPITFSSASGVGSDDPTVAPVLHITYGAASTSPAAIDDHAQSIYGVSGAFGSCGTEATVCKDLTTNIAAVASRLQGQFIRIAAPLACASALPLRTDYWDSIYQQMQAAYDATPTVYPVINFTPPAISATCPALSPQDWATELGDFLGHISTSAVIMADPIPTTYFEIGNEPNYTPLIPRYSDVNGTFIYPQLFAAAAHALAQGLTPTVTGRVWTSYRILTGGMLSPDAVDDHSCIYPVVHADALETTEAAIAAATAGTNGDTINPGVLGVAIHPYGYATSGFDNVAAAEGKSGSNVVGECSDIGKMNSVWQQHFPGMPIVYTEVNYATTRIPPTDPQDPYIPLTGAYLVDLFSYLQDTGEADATISPLRVMWFRGNDVVESDPNSGGAPARDVLGLWKTDGSDKNYLAHTCHLNVGPLAPLPEATYYALLRHNSCYQPVPAQPAPLIVSTTADSGPGSLRDTLAHAHTGDIISFPHDLGTITLSSGQLDIGTDLTIAGPNGSTQTINGGSASRVVHIANGTTVELRNLTITGGHTVAGDSGGGILNDGSLTIVNSTIQGNATADGADATTSGGYGGNAGTGGGIANAGTLTITASTVADNQTGTGGRGGDGDQLCIFGICVGNPPGLGGSGGNGGGLDNLPGGSMTIVNSTIASNTTGSGGHGGCENGHCSGGGNGGSGGGSSAAERSRSLSARLRRMSWAQRATIAARSMARVVAWARQPARCRSGRQSSRITAVPQGPTISRVTRAFLSTRAAITSSRPRRSRISASFVPSPAPQRPLSPIWILFSVLSEIMVGQLIR